MYNIFVIPFYLILTAAPLFQINTFVHKTKTNNVFQILCNKNLASGPGKPHSAML